METANIWDELKKKREIYLTKWANELPAVRRIGLVVSDASTFTNRGKKNVDNLKNRSKNEDNIDIFAQQQEMSQKMMSLGTDLGAGRINFEEFQRLQAELMLDMSMSSVSAANRPTIKRMIQENVIPGATDDLSGRVLFMTHMNSLLNRFGDEKLALDVYREHTVAVAASESLPFNEKNAQQILLGMVLAMRDPDESLWRTYEKEMYDAKDKYLANQITVDEYRNKLGELMNKGVLATLGIDVDFTGLARLSLNLCHEVLQQDIQQNDKTRRRSNDSIEGYAIASLLNLHLYTSALMRETQNIVDWNQDETITSENLDKFVKTIDQSTLEPLISLVEQDAAGSWTYARLLLHVYRFILLMNITRYSRMTAESNYTTTFTSTEGEYVFRASNPRYHAYLLDQVKQWLPIAQKTSWPVQITQKLCDALTSFAEMGRDYDMLHEICDLSLRASDGLVNQLTPAEIPLGYAYYLEKHQHNYDRALHYYMLALDSLKFHFPPILSDTILYRTVCVLTRPNGSTPADHQKALIIIGKCHPHFQGTLCAAVTPARRLTLRVADDIAKQLGYHDAKSAIAVLLGGGDASGH